MGHAEEEEVGEGRVGGGRAAGCSQSQFLSQMFPLLQCVFRRRVAVQTDRNSGPEQQSHTDIAESVVVGYHRLNVVSCSANQIDRVRQILKGHTHTH